MVGFTKEKENQLEIIKNRYKITDCFYTKNIYPAEDTDETQKKEHSMKIITAR